MNEEKEDPDILAARKRAAVDRAAVDRELAKAEALLRENQATRYALREAAQARENALTCLRTAQEAAEANDSLLQELEQAYRQARRDVDEFNATLGTAYKDALDAWREFDLWECDHEEDCWWEDAYGEVLQKAPDGSQGLDHPVIARRWRLHIAAEKASAAYHQRLASIMDLPEVKAAQAAYDTAVAAHRALDGSGKEAAALLKVEQERAARVLDGWHKHLEEGRKLLPDEPPLRGDDEYPR